MKFLEEFKEFAFKGNVIDLAVGVIIGGAFQGIVKAFTDDFINPIICGIGGAEVQGKFRIWGGQYIQYGDFITAIINFLITAFILFLFIKAINKLSNIRKKPAEEITPAVPEPSAEEKLLVEIRDLLAKNK